MLWIACLFPPSSINPSAPQNPVNSPVRQQIERAGQWALQFTPEACLTQSGNGILLEVSRCLRLWGGLNQLKNQLVQGLQTLEGTGTNTLIFFGLAPTPRAAEWLAYDRQFRNKPWPNQAQALSLQGLERLLARLPLQVPHELQCCTAFLRSIGIHDLGGLLRLPRQGFAQRLGQQGPAVLKTIDQAMGYVADPREPLKPAEHFLQWRDFTVPTDSCSLLAKASEPLLHEALGWLKVKQQGLTQAQFILRQGRQNQQTFRLQLSQPSQDLVQLQMLLQEKLQHQPLQQTVHSIGLEVLGSEPILGQSENLFPGPISASESLQGLAERLYSRLGPKVLVGPELQNSHRPEEAMRLNPVEPKNNCWPQNKSAASTNNLLRPSWLLELPIALKVQNHRPHYQGQKLQLVLGPERIEAEWWSEDPVQRDYFVAQTNQQQMVWVYRTPGHHWFLHGFFG
jgi:protein ImuB